MFDHNSRYYNLETAQWVMTDGHRVGYKRRRFLPLNAQQTLLAEVAVTEGDRLDRITARILGDPEQFWQLCDMNQAMNPADVLQPTGRTLRVVLPQPQMTLPPLPPGIQPNA